MIDLRIPAALSDAAMAGEANPRWPQIKLTVDYIVERLRAGEEAHLMFVCTHNSRRSQFAYVWAEVFARSFGLFDVSCYSGGTEVTECNIRTAAALRRFGFGVETNGGDNPDYLITYSDTHPAIICNSSLFAHSGLTDFAAMMCCADVDEKCPTVPGATIRVPLHYDDPKSADDTPEEETRYDERCQQIGADMMQIMMTAKNLLRL